MRRGVRVHRLTAAGVAPAPQRRRYRRCANCRAVPHAVISGTAHAEAASSALCRAVKCMHRMPCLGHQSLQGALGGGLRPRQLGSECELRAECQLRAARCAADRASEKMKRHESCHMTAAEISGCTRPHVSAAPSPCTWPRSCCRAPACPAGGGSAARTGAREATCCSGSQRHAGLTVQLPRLHHACGKKWRGGGLPRRPLLGGPLCGHACTSCTMRPAC